MDMLKRDKCLPPSSHPTPFTVRYTVRLCGRVWPQARWLERHKADRVEVEALNQRLFERNHASIGNMKVRCTGVSLALSRGLQVPQVLLTYAGFGLCAARPTPLARYARPFSLCSA